MKRTGRCLCGDVRFSYEGPENWQGYCHCESCRRNCAAPVTAFMGVPNDALRWDGMPPATFASSPKVTRSFCSNCGTPVAYQSTDYPEETHLYAALLNDPQEFKPRQHFHWSERLNWLDLQDDLDKRG